MIIIANTVLNTALSAHALMSMFRRSQLRDLARIHGIKRGRNASDTAGYLALGTPSSTATNEQALVDHRVCIVFQIRINVDNGSSTSAHH